MDIRLIRTLRTLVIALSLIPVGTEISTAQEYVNTPVSISKEKVKINGQVCYSHVVLERQTLFSICKAYNVSVDDIYKFNPAVKENGLVKNSIIIIPLVEDTAAVTVAEPAKTEKNEAVSVSVEQESASQEVKAAETKAEQNSEEVKSKKRKTHTVKWYESLEDIAIRYGISPEEIIAANNLDNRKIKSRMKLIIPEPGETVTVLAEAEEVKAQIDSNTVASPSEAESSDQESPWWQFKKNDKVNAALLLPFKANGTSGSRSNMDFYSGVLLAVNDLAAAGISTDLKVYDIADGNYTANSAIGASDLVIGPISVKDITATLPSVSSSAALISPLDPKAESLIDGHANMIQAPTPHKLQYDDLAAWLKEDCKPQDRVILITEKGARLTEATLDMKHSVDSTGLNYKTFSYSILEGRDVMNPLKGLMTQEAANRIMILSENEAFVNDVVRNLNLMIHQKYDVILYGASKIRSFETIEVENFHKTNLHVSLTYYIDYNDQRVKNFLLKYRALFNTEPTQFAFQGYDIASYFIELRSKYGKNWMYQLSNDERSMLQSTFKCLQDENGGYVNHGVRRIVYEKDWTVSKLK